jgi:hypothetical protein
MIKAWGTDIGCEVASLGVQIHGGMGFIEETGAAQHFRDARIAPIYEGTNGIQAADLVTRKLSYEGGEVLNSLFAEIVADCSDAPTLQALAQDCIDVARWMNTDASIDDKLAGSVPFCHMAATAVAGWQLQRQARDGAGGQQKAVIARYFNEHLAAEARGQKSLATAGADLFYILSADALTGQVC